MGQININGKEYSGSNLQIVNGIVKIDGKVVESHDKKINIYVTGDITMLSVDSCDSLEITGEVKSVSSISGDVVINGNVDGNINTVSGDVKCRNHDGNATTVSGDIIRG